MLFFLNSVLIWYNQDISGFTSNWVDLLLLENTQATVSYPQHIFDAVPASEWVELSPKQINKNPQNPTNILATENVVSS